MSLKLAIFTEEEAKQRWCPFTRGIPSGANRITAPNAEIMAMGVGPCLGSGCMAWRWEATHIFDAEALGNDGKPPGTREVGDVYGRCGLAGTP